ncbi:SDR family oxidoreductase [Ruegeria sp. 2205SS24-7]|uniref:SDR family oxidoreductase n=1 Tax=Ruegeria discodermiae TaxID=3064389 RepID=UPI0027410AD4|nr:SDR family oxidoreductase [Ruegeria sp. 2205SS24-7]MDP5218684.1 SDR family oxidoreductase [Ruegeria sp. 2205SS24-7]
MTAHVLVLGAYGFIGSAVVRALQERNLRVTGLVRNRRVAARVLPNVPIRVADLRALTDASGWSGLLSDIDVVVNCAGALQDGGGDDLEAVHHLAIAALGAACAERDIAVVQVSAVGADPQAPTVFMQSKARGDAALRRSGVSLHLLRPGLVIGQSAYGGTALLRMLAAVPLLQPLALGRVPIQCVGLSDLCRVITDAIEGQLAPGCYDLVEAHPRDLAGVVASTREWLGFEPARYVIEMPGWFTGGASRIADLLGHLGWRSPLRSTALTVLRDGITGDPSAYAATGGHIRPLPEIYASQDCTRAERQEARLSLLMPLILAVLCIFWCISGVIGLFRINAAADVLRQAGWGSSLAVASVLFWSLADLALGAGLLLRRWAALACIGQVAVSSAYLLAATFVVPRLWADPLGPLVKILPAAMLSVILYTLLEDR